MLFTYTYRSSDGQRHTAEIEAESRDDAFAAIRRELGVKPIRVVAAGGRGDVNGRDARSPGGRTVAGIAFAAFVLLMAGGAAWWLAGRRSDAPYQVMTPQGPVTYTVATTLPRQAIPGDRRRIEAAMGGRAANGQDARSPSVFRSPAETYLARFAEPGRPVGDLGHKETASASLPPTEEEFRACLREPVRVASTDFTEIVDLKRIVAGMKREMQAYLAGGGTTEQYLAELVKRQRLEISYREHAEQKLNELLSNHGSSPEQSNPQTLNGSRGRSPSRSFTFHPSPFTYSQPSTARVDARPPDNSNTDNLRAAYAYWLKANATLKSMGIYELPLPEALYGYQAGLDLGE